MPTACWAGSRIDDSRALCYTEFRKLETGVTNMKTIWQKFARLFYAYGVFGARIPSVHGSYEAKVPEELKE